MFVSEVCEFGQIQFALPATTYISGHKVYCLCPAMADGHTHGEKPDGVRYGMASAKGLPGNSMEHVVVLNPDA